VVMYLIYLKKQLEIIWDGNFINMNNKLRFENALQEVI